MGVGEVYVYVLNTVDIHSLSCCVFFPIACAPCPVLSPYLSLSLFISWVFIAGRLPGILGVNHLFSKYLIIYLTTGIKCPIV